MRSRHSTSVQLAVRPPQATDAESLFRSGRRPPQHSGRDVILACMTSTNPALLALRDHPVLPAIPRMLGYAPAESLVLVPLRRGDTSGALRFSIPEGDHESAARAFLGAMGRFGRADTAVAAVYSDRPQRPVVRRLVEALALRAGRIGLEGLVVVVPDRGGAPAASEGEHALLPLIDRGERLAVAGQVDALLDRHPRAELPEHLATAAEAALRRAASGSPERPRAETVAALIVCAQRSGWLDRAVATVVAIRRSGPRGAAVLVAVAAASAPRTERAAVLVLLAVLHRLAGDHRRALAAVEEAERCDPLDHRARRLRAAFDGTRSPERPSPALEVA